jgi:hypothetical protein
MGENVLIDRGLTVPGNSMGTVLVPPNQSKISIVRAPSQRDGYGASRDARDPVSSRDDSKDKGKVQVAWHVGFLLKPPSAGPGERPFVQTTEAVPFRYLASTRGPWGLRRSMAASTCVPSRQVFL